jgi:metalloendopeptidase OMA1, mitochondrial
MQTLSFRGGGGLRIWPLLVFAVFAIFYYFQNRETVPVTGRSQIVALSPREEAALGLSSYREILGQARVVESGPEVEMVQRIGRQLAKVSDDPGFEWEFNLIDDPQVNAFCLPGGKVAVFTGLLPVAQNEDGLAVVMGHEIAHAIARHGAERLAHQQLAQLGQVAVGVATGEMDESKRRLVWGALGVGTQFGVLLPFSRKHESEADYIGLKYVARACFNPREAPKLWKRMAGASGRAGAPEFLSTHPSDETRIAQFAEWMPQALGERPSHCQALRQ